MYCMAFHICNGKVSPVGVTVNRHAVTVLLTIEAHPEIVSGLIVKQEVKNNGKISSSKKDRLVKG
jgi:hypothetical protein